MLYSVELGSHSLNASAKVGHFFEPTKYFGVFFRRGAKFVVSRASEGRKGYRLTTLVGLPCIKAATFATAMSIKRLLASKVAHAMCGVM